jgi:uncharacterized protein
MNENTLEENNFILQLFVTEKCNLNCKYCYEKGIKRKDSMSPQIAESTLNRIIPQLDMYDNVLIDLIGGEPLLSFELIKYLISLAKKQQDVWQKKVTFFASTNGTLLTDEMKDWFYLNKENITLGLSLDGTKQAQDLNRSKSYNLIEPHLSFFKETWPYQPVKMTINPRVIDQVYDGVTHIYSLGLKCTANVVFEDVWRSKKREQQLEIFESELDKLVDFFSQRPELDEPGLILKLPIENCIRNVEKDWSWCGAGRTMKCFFLEGQEFDCHRFATTLLSKQLTCDDEKNYFELNPKCKDCKFYFACPTCDAFNYEINNNRNYKTDFHCDLIKMQILATAKLRYKRLYQNIMKLHSKDIRIEDISEIVSTIKSILYVSENISIPNYDLSHGGLTSSISNTLEYADSLKSAITFQDI